MMMKHRVVAQSTTSVFTGEDNDVYPFAPRQRKRQLRPVVVPWGRRRGSGWSLQHSRRLRRSHTQRNVWWTVVLAGILFMGVFLLTKNKSSPSFLANTVVRVVFESAVTTPSSLYPPRNHVSFPLYDDTLWTDDEWNEEPDYADLDFATYPTNLFARTPWVDEYRDYEQQRAVLLEDMDRNDGGPPVFSADDDASQLLGPCRPSAWKQDIHPTCNMVHETAIDIGRDVYVGSGAFRQTWKLYDPTDTVYVLKQSLLPENDQDIEHKPTFLSFYKTYQDARVMERLTASPRIVRIYAHCGLTIASEAMTGEIVNRIVPGTGLVPQTELDQQPFGPRNTNMTAEEKLDVALSMVTSLADLHGEPGIIVHGDVHPVQWLRAADGTIRLNDFNAAELLDYDVEYGGYCKKDRGPWGGRYRSPEEFLGLPVNEKIDVYSMGNNLYTLLTGLWPFHDHDDYDVVQEKILTQRELPFIDDRYRQRSYIEKKLVELMEQAWAYSPEDRPSIFYMVKFLSDVKTHVQDAGTRRAPRIERSWH